MWAILEEGLSAAIRLLEDHPDLAKAILDHLLSAIGASRGASDVALTEIASGIAATTANAVQEAVRRGQVKAGTT